MNACKVDVVDKSDEYDPFLVGAYSKPIFEYMMTLEVIAVVNCKIIFKNFLIVPLLNTYGLGPTHNTARLFSQS